MSKQKKQTENPSKDLRKNTKKVKGRIKTLRALPYFDCLVYIREIKISGKRTFFEYLVPIKGEIYSSYMEFTHKKKLTDAQRSNAVGLILAGAMTTVETILEIKPKEKDKKMKKLAKELIKNNG